MKKLSLSLVLTFCLCLLTAGASCALSLDEMRTPAEESGFTKTTSSKEVFDFCKNAAALSKGRVRLEVMGYSPMGKPMPLLVVGNPAPSSPKELNGRVVAYINCNIHSGEIEGKEAMLIFAREAAQGRHDKMLKNMVVLISPNMNLDGNDMLAEHRIDSQPEPRLVGSRLTAQGLNLNRDFMKLEQPECRAMMKELKKWQPALIMDAHATNGSRIRHAVTYHWSYNANTDKELSDFNSKKFIPAAMGKGSMLDVKYGRTTRPYGNFFSPIVEEEWWDNPSAGYWSKTNDEDLPRYAFNYVGLRKMVSVLLECYSWDPYKTRVETQYACIYGSLSELSKQKDVVQGFVKKLNEKESSRAKNGLNGETVVLTTSRDVTELLDIDSYVYEPVMSDDKKTVLEWVANIDKPMTYKNMKHLATFTPVVERYLPAYYFVPAGCFNAVETLFLHDIDVQQLKRDTEVTVNRYKKFDNNIDPYFGYYEGHTRRLLTGGEWVKSKEVIPAGTYVISTSQRNGKLAAVLLEPESNDGLASWNFFDTMISRRKAARVYPVAKSLTDYSVIEDKNMEIVTCTPLDWNLSK